MSERKSPTASATTFPEGTIQWGNNKKRWVVKKNIKGIQRWVPIASTDLFGYKLLTADYLAKNIGIPITIYERQLSYKWPKSSKDFDVKYKFTANGDAHRDAIRDANKKYENWLKTRKPRVKKNDIFIIDGIMKSKNIVATIQVGCSPEELVSTNLLNTDAFIKI